MQRLLLKKTFSSTAGAIRGTTILCVRRGPKVVMIGDGQVTKNNTLLKADAKKVRRLVDGSVIAGFAGSTADAFSLLDRLEAQLKQHRGQLLRSCVELAKMWRTDRYLRHLHSTLLAADEDTTLEVTGSGDVLVCDSRGVMAIGSGGMYALAAARALVDNTQLDAREVALKAMNVASELCVYTNHTYTVESLTNRAPRQPKGEEGDAVGC